MAAVAAAIVATTPPTLIATLLTTFMAMVPTRRWAMDLGHINHQRGWCWQVNDPWGWGMNHLAPPSLRMNLNMAETGMHQNRRLQKDRVGATRLGQAQQQTAHEQALASPFFEQQHGHVDSCERAGGPKAYLPL